LFTGSTLKILKQKVNGKQCFHNQPARAFTKQLKSRFKNTTKEDSD
jgi:hypothetical protein